MNPKNIGIVGDSLVLYRSAIVLQATEIPKTAYMLKTYDNSRGRHLHKCTADGKGDAVFVLKSGQLGFVITRVRYSSLETRVKMLEIGRLGPSGSMDLVWVHFVYMCV